jgi:hypothetical protein
VTAVMGSDLACALRSCRLARLVGRVNGGACAIACDAEGARSLDRCRTSPGGNASRMQRGAVVMNDIFKDAS